MTSQSLSNRRVAVLDLGTNTFHLLIVEVSPNRSFKKVFKSKMVVKLGEDGIHRNFIAEKAFTRGVRALKHYSEIIRQYKVNVVHAFATAAIRGAGNGKEFIETVFKATGINITMIKGEEEARLICLGVRQCIKLGQKPVLIMDIGGGSTEFIIADQNIIYARHSFNIGAARLLELFKPSDPVKAEEVNLIEQFLESQLADLDISLKKFKVKMLIGSSGSFDTFAEMIGHRFYGRNVLNNVNCYTFELSEYCELHELLIHSTLQQRNGMKGLIKMRVDMIVLASICTKFVLHRYGLNEMLLSKYALKEGAMWEIIHNGHFWKKTKGIPVSAGSAFVKN